MKDDTNRSKHRKIHERDNDIPQELPRKSPPTFAQTGARLNQAKRQRQTENHETAQSDGSPTPAYQPREVLTEPAHLSVSNSIPIQNTFSPRHPEVIDWNIQWPFYGEGLHSVNLDWTLDFLSQGISTHSPLDTVHEFDGPSFMAKLNSPAVPDANTGQPGIDSNDSDEDEPQAWSDHGSRRVTRNQHDTSYTPQKQAAHFDSDERIAFFAANTWRLEASSQIAEETRVAMLELMDFAAKKANPNTPFRVSSELTIFYNFILFMCTPASL
ncbi:hypothetical protein N7490_008376 [Penicillium lividum]|nr:hypothetical protein N7490_008376 [Penicillium lividum]